MSDPEPDPFLLIWWSVCVHLVLYLLLCLALSTLWHGWA